MLACSEFRLKYLPGALEILGCLFKLLRIRRVIVVRSSVHFVRGICYYSRMECIRH